MDIRTKVCATFYIKLLPTWCRLVCSYTLVQISTQIDLSILTVYLLMSAHNPCKTIWAMIRPNEMPVLISTPCQMLWWCSWNIIVFKALLKCKWQKYANFPSLQIQYSYHFLEIDNNVIDKSPGSRVQRHENTALIVTLKMSMMAFAIYSCAFFIKFQDVVSIICQQTVQTKHYPSFLFQI